MIERYVHHRAWVAVRSELKGKHREYCLCHQCKHFHPKDRVQNCPTANMLYRLCVEYDVVTPVWECRKFDLREDEDTEKEEK